MKGLRYIMDEVSRMIRVIISIMYAIMNGVIGKFISQYTPINPEYTRLFIGIMFGMIAIGVMSFMDLIEIRKLKKDHTLSWDMALRACALAIGLSLSILNVLVPIVITLINSFTL